MTGPTGTASVPVEAILPGTILKDHRVTFDYEARRLTLDRSSALVPRGVKVPIRVNPATGLPSISAIVEEATQHGRPTVTGVEVGDRPLQVDAMMVSGATRGALFRALHGTPGAPRVLVVERGGRTLNVPVRTSAF